jgi:radical SAM family uncharacterized protein
MSDFNFIGFSLPHELNYTNVLTLLDLGGIPLKASDRDSNHPFVIGGGPCVLNPEPLHAFFDFFVIGEGEEAIHEILQLYRSFKDDLYKGRITRLQILAKFASIEGVYVPLLYDVDYDKDGALIKFIPKFENIPQVVKKRIVKDLDNMYFPAQWLLPYIQIVHDRITLEIMRGCPNSCRFCQGRSQYYPFRQRSVNAILSLAVKSYSCTGYEEISLAGLSVSDYKDIEKLLDELTKIFYDRKVNLSLPSIKPKNYVGRISETISKIKKTGLTFAPEAASERLRKLIGKDFDMTVFNEALRQSYAAGYQHVKLYFLIGLPQETDQDLDQIVRFAEDVSSMRKPFGKGPAHVNISVNTLIPKPHTPFQWLKMLDLESIKQKQVYLKKMMKNGRIKMDFHDSYMSVIEGIFSRGDRRLSEVLLAAFKKGARFDAWRNRFNYSIWELSFKECCLDPLIYLGERPKEARLPWSFLDIGISESYLLSEFNKLLQ